MAASALPSSSSIASNDDVIREKILWSCVARNNVILAEAGEDVFEDGSVTQTARELLARKATPGFEFHTQTRSILLRGVGSSSSTHAPRLKGVKFHLHDTVHNEFGVPENVVWVYAAVYDPHQFDKKSVQAFLDKIVTLSEIFRESNQWRWGGTLAAQTDFAPILLQRMQEVTYLGKMALLEDQLESTQRIMHQNIERILERQEKLETLNERGTRLNEMATVFRKKSRNLRRRQMMQNAKYGVILGTAVTAGVAVVVVPPLLAIL